MPTRSFCKPCCESIGGELGLMFCTLKGHDVTIVEECPLGHKTPEDVLKGNKEKLERIKKSWRK